jgi:hypothetical protein
VAQTIWKQRQSHWVLARWQRAQLHGLSKRLQDLRRSSVLAIAGLQTLSTGRIDSKLRPLSRLRPQSCDHRSTRPQNFSFSFSSRFAFGSRQLRACRSRGSVSGAVPPRGVMRQQSRHFISTLPLCALKASCQNEMVLSWLLVSRQPIRFNP